MKLVYKCSWSEWKKHNLNEYWKYIVLKICHMLNAKTPPSPTVTLCVKWLYPSLSPILTHIFWMAPLLFLHFFENICNILVTGHLDSGLPTWNRQVMSVYQYFTWAFIIQKCFAQLFSNYIWLCKFWQKNVGTKAARKMLMKLTTGDVILATGTTQTPTFLENHVRASLPDWIFISDPCYYKNADGNVTLVDNCL